WRTVFAVSNDIRIEANFESAALRAQLEQRTRVRCHTNLNRRGSKFGSPGSVACDGTLSRQKPEPPSASLEDSDDVCWRTGRARDRLAPPQAKQGGFASANTRKSLEHSA